MIYLVFAFVNDQPLGGADDLLWAFTASDDDLAYQWFEYAIRAVPAERRGMAQLVRADAKQLGPWPTGFSVIEEILL